MKRYYTFILFLLTGTICQAQELVSYELIGTTQAFVLNLGAPGLNAQYDVDQYRITYMTVDARGNEHVASGAICVPQNDGTLAFPLAAYQHGTVAGREDVPSTGNGGVLLAIAFASKGYVVCAADFIGLGESPGVHPYVHAATEASAAIDLMYAAQELEQEIDAYNLNDQVFVSGYSQGGHAAMALHRELELNPGLGFTVTAAAPMSGPYSISGKMVDFTLGDDPYRTVSYLAWLTLGYMEAYPDLLEGLALEDVFKPEYIADIIEFQNENIDLWELNGRMSDTLFATVGDTIPKFTLQPEILEALLNDPSHPMSMALADNDTYNWAPQSPTQLIYCVGDDQVTYENAILAEEVMTANGSAVVEAVRMDTDAEPLDHGGCVFPAAFHVIDWFGTFQDILSSTDAVSDVEGLSIIQMEHEVMVKLDNPKYDDSTVRIMDMNGRSLAISNISQGENRIDISDLSAGFYVLNVMDSNLLLGAKKLIR